MGEKWRSRWPSCRPSGRPLRSGTVLPETPKRGSRRLDCSGKDPDARRKSARGMEHRRDHRLRFSEHRRQVAGGPYGQGCAERSVSAQDYSARHERSLEAIAAGNVSSSGKGNVTPLFLPYLVKIILDGGYEGLEHGMRRSSIQERIQRIHHRPDDVRASDMSNLLYNLASLQASKNISPPIIDYDQSTKLLQVVDSTFYFFLKNADLKAIADELMNPVTDSAGRDRTQEPLPFRETT
jgi:hypothetical protein